MNKFKTMLEDVEIIKDVKKHGTGDQKPHGSWANLSVGGKTVEGTTITSLIDKLSEKRTPGFTIDIRTKQSPKNGFIASDKGAEKVLEWAPLKASRSKLRSALRDFVEVHEELLDGKGSFMGGWVEKGKLYLDVSRRYSSRSEGVQAGFRNKQKAIYDVINDSYIYMKDEVDERTNKARAGGDSQASQGNDGAGEGRLRGRNLGSDRGQSVKFPHVCLGRYTVQKHREGEHDQSTHGNWAGERYPEDSVKGARDGAKEYAFKKGLKPDDTIDYTKVVANRERASKIADIYENLPEMDRDAVDEYEALASEVEEQFDYMTKTLGVKVEFVADDPYKTSKEMFADVSRGVLKVLQTETTGAHPLFSDTQNNKFRAVHDYFGHAATGRGFGQDGEEAAWVHHSQMFTEKARAALTTETRGQNSFFNNRGKQFADQKVALLPAEFWQVPATFQKFKIIRFAAGLKPVFKHQEHTQSDHGNWARGVTGKEDALINEMDGVGPSLDDLQKVIDGPEQPGMEDLIDFINNNREFYNAATEGINERVAESLANLQQEFPNHEYSEQEKSTIYDNVQTEMIDEHAQNDDGSIAQLWQEQNGGAAPEPYELVPFFEEVYNMSHDVIDRNGEVYTTLDSRVDEVYSDGDRVTVNGTIADSTGNYAGEYARGFRRGRDADGNDIWVVDHDLFKMTDEYSGVGFGSKFIARQEAWYTATGFGRIDVSTAWDGARHWAKAGYDFDARATESNAEKLISGMRTLQFGDNTDFDIGTPARVEFDLLMNRMTSGYTPVRDKSESPTFSGVRNLSEETFPIPNDFAMIGYKDRVKIGENEITGRPIYTWAGAKLMMAENGLNLKYQKGLTKEGRSLIDGPIDRDGDGLVFDGTPRERPASGGKLGS